MQSLTGLTTDTCLIADPGAPAWSHTFVVFHREIISTAILLPLLIQGGLLSVTSKIMCTTYW